jgi:hypothetical protein
MSDAADKALVDQMSVEMANEIDDEINEIMRDDWCEEGVVIVDTRVFPARVFRIEGIFYNTRGSITKQTSFQAICVFSGERLQGYSLDGGKPRLPENWEIVNGMEILAWASLTREEWLARFRARG